MSLIGSLVFITSSLQPVALNACGPVDFSYHYFNLFVPEWLFDKEYEPTFATTHEYRHIWGTTDYANDNLRSWQSFLPGVEKEALEYLLYDTYHQEYRSLGRRALVNEKIFERNSLGAKGPSAKAYFNLALDLEKIANQPADAWYYRTKDTLSSAGKEKLILDLKRQLEQEKFPFLEKRYAYQLMKAYRYTGQLDKAMQVYDKYFKEQEQKSMIDYWAMDHMAGMQLEKEENGKAYYHFLKVFQECRSRRYSAYYGFNISNEKDWQATYALCSTPEEKALMHFIRGSKEGALGLQDGKDIFSLLGNHEWLKLLVAREINKLEKENFNYFGEAPIADLLVRLHEEGHMLLNKEFHAYANELLRFVNTVYYNNRQDGFWTAAKAYLEFITGSLSTAKATLGANNSLKAPYSKIARELKLAMLIIEYDDFSVQQQDYIAAEMVDLFDDQATRWYTERNNQEFILELLAFKTGDSDQKMLSEMFARNILLNEKDNPEMSHIEELLSFVKQPAHTKLEFLALKHYFGIHHSFDDFLMDTTAYLEEMEYTLLDVKGTLLMRDPDQLEEALSIFQSLPDTFDYALQHNPFNMGIKDCVWDCLPSTSTSYTRNSFVEKLVEIKDKADRLHSPTDYYLLGNAYYNMTYFGPAYYLMSYFRSGSSYAGFYNCEAALDFYKNAIKYAPSNEFAAKACFMAAKAEQNLYFVQKTEQKDDPDQYWWGKYEVPDTYFDAERYKAFHREIKAAGYRTYYEKLNTVYKNTDYYQKAIRECKYFEYYTNRM